MSLETCAHRHSLTCGRQPQGSRRDDLHTPPAPTVHPDHRSNERAAEPALSGAHSALNACVAKDDAVVVPRGWGPMVFSCVVIAMALFVIIGSPFILTQGVWLAEIVAIGSDDA